MYHPSLSKLEKINTSIHKKVTFLCLSSTNVYSSVIKLRLRCTRECDTSQKKYRVKLELYFSGLVFVSITSLWSHLQSSVNKHQNTLIALQRLLDSVLKKINNLTT